MLNFSSFGSSCLIIRPFSGEDIVASAVACQLIPGMGEAIGLKWTHQLIVSPTTDIRDGCTRTIDDNSLQYMDGDEVRIPSGSANRYVVVWVETIAENTPQAYRRAYLMRHAT